MNSSSQQISIIVPVLNEQDLVDTLWKAIRAGVVSAGVLEVIFVDGGSTDETIARAEALGARVLRSDKGRAKQMNFGARKAKGDILYFIHADTVPPEGFDQTIISAVDKGKDAGCFRMKFNSNSRFLKFFSWFTKINHWLCRGGDQSLFISRKRFELMGGFNEDYKVYEDLEFIGRLYRKGRFNVLPHYVITSARKYEQVGKYRLQYHFAIIHLKNYMGSHPDALYAYYQRHILP